MNLVVEVFGEVKCNWESHIGLSSIRCNHIEIQMINISILSVFVSFCCVLGVLLRVLTTPYAAHIWFLKLTDGKKHYFVICQLIFLLKCKPTEVFKFRIYFGWLNITYLISINTCKSFLVICNWLEQMGSFFFKM